MSVHHSDEPEAAGSTVPDGNLPIAVTYAALVLRRSLAPIVGALPLCLGLGGLGFLAAGGAAAPASAAAPARVPATVRGSLTLASRGDWSRTDGSGCEGAGLYGDVGEGTSVTVRDGFERVLLRTDLRAGRSAQSPSSAPGCRFRFELSGLKPASLYHLVIGPERNIVYQDDFTSADDRLRHGGLQFTIRSAA